MATWTNELPYGNAVSIQYNAAITYNSALYNYNGQAVTVWSNQTKS
jgi:hypothetical protein